MLARLLLIYCRSRPKICNPLTHSNVPAYLPTYLRKYVSSLIWVFSGLVLTMILLFRSVEEENNLKHDSLIYHGAGKWQSLEKIVPENIPNLFFSYHLWDILKLVWYLKSRSLGTPAKKLPSRHIFSSGIFLISALFWYHDA